MLIIQIFLNSTPPAKKKKRIKNDVCSLTNLNIVMHIVHYRNIVI